MGVLQGAGSIEGASGGEFGLDAGACQYDAPNSDSGISMPTTG